MNSDPLLKLDTVTDIPELSGDIRQSDPATNSAAESKPAEQAPDPFDLDRLVLDQSTTATVGVKKLITVVPVKKPDKQAFVRVHPSPSYRQNFPLIILKQDHEVFLVSREMQGELATECVPATIYTAITAQKVVQLWPVRLPGADGKDMTWWSSEREAAERAMKNWIRVMPNMGLGANEIFVAEQMGLEPEWPSLTFQELLRIAFGLRLVDSLNHPVVKRLRGLT